MGRLLGALQTLGAARQRDGSLLLDLVQLELTSLFGGALVGTASCAIAGDALAFKNPPELAACGRLWLPDIADEEALVQAVTDAHGELRARVNEAFATLRRLGFKARLQAPEPRARGSVQLDGVAVVVAIDASGDLVVESVDGRAVDAGQRRSLAAPEEATPAEALALVGDVVRAAQRRPAPAMSQEELDELQAALSDDDDLLSSSEEAEPTAAGVPMPVRPTRIPSDFDDGGTLQLAIGPGNDFTHEIGPDDESDIGTLKVRFDANDVKAAQAGRQQAPAQDRSLLDEFDDDGALPPAPQPARRSPPVPTRSIDVDFDSDEADGFADSPEPTATRPHVGGAATVAIATRQAPRAVDDEENDLLAALDDDDNSELDSALPPPVDDDFAGFPALDVEGPGFIGGATSVNAADEMIPSAPPTAAAMPPPTPRSASTPPRPVNDFEDPTGGVAGTDDEFDDGKTRALVVDAALLARLKLGDAQGEPPAVASAAPPPALSLLEERPATAFVAGGLDDDDDNSDDDLAVPPIGASDESEGATPPADGLEDGAVSAPMRARADDNDGDLASMLDDEPELETPPPTIAQLVQPPIDDDDDDGDLDALLARELELLRDLDDVRARITAMRAAREVTDHAALVARRSQAPTVMPTKRPTQPSTPVAKPSSSSSSSSSRPQPTSSPSSSSSSSSSSSRPQPAAPPSVDHFAVVGASNEHSAEAETNAAGGIASLPSMKSIDVHEILPPPGARNGLLDALDGFDDDVPAPVVSNKPAALEDDDVVSLAALQGALKEMGVDIDSGQTQVAAAMPFALPADNDDDGDVFGSNVSGGGFEQPTPDPSSAPASELSHEATRVRQARPASIGIVVEDERARSRLRKHLVDRFAELFEAEDCAAAVALKSLGQLDAIVFVRPTDNEPTRAGFARLNMLPRRPRVLVISGNEHFDELPAVDLRLPLAQKASEVARQVLEGLERLGIQSSPGP